MPMVLDELNTIVNLHHHYKAYGGWSFALKDYWELNYTASLDTEANRMLMEIIDPLVYKEIYEQIPYMFISTTGDEFLLPDNANFFWN